MNISSIPEIEVGQIDPDLMKQADRALIERWMQEARENPPDIEEWAVLVASLRFAAEVERRGEEDARLPKGMTSVVRGVRAMANFIIGHQNLKEDRLHAPLFRFFAAIVDLSEEKTPVIFKPVKSNGPRPGRPGADAVQANVQGVCSRAMTELMDSGLPLKDAAKKVMKAATAGGARGHAALSAQKIQDWRDQIMAGHGAASPIAIARYHALLPAAAGNTARERSEWLLASLEKSPMLK